MEIITRCIAACIVAHVVGGCATCQDEPIDSTGAFSVLQKMLVMEKAQGQASKQRAIIPNPEKKGIQVAGAGLPRTGTESLAAAMQILGYHPSHGEEFKQSTDDLTYPFTMQSVDKARDGQPEDMLSALALEGADSCFDGPLNEFYQLFRARYGAKVILSIHPRGADGWIESLLKFARYANIESTYPYREHVKFENGCTMPTAPNATIADLSFEMLELCRTTYENHNADIMKSVPPGELLVFNVTQGWAPLCKFLGKPLPTVEFPHVDCVDDKRNRLCTCGLRCPSMLVSGRRPQIPGDEALIPGDAFDNCT